MKTMICCIACITVGSILPLCGCDSNADPQTTRTTTTSDRNTIRTPSDDTARGTLTAMDQSQSSEHVEQTAAIRRAIVADDGLSIRAKNCVIITDDSGRVWLQGVVNTENEKNLIESAARQIAGADNVTNELEVTAS